MKTVVYQSYRTDEVPAWIQRCLDSVQGWAGDREYDYQFSGDEFFDLLPDDYRAKAAGRSPILSDLARLILARNLLDEGYQRTLWVDADVLIFDPVGFEITIDQNFAFCREVWIQADGHGGLKAFRNVHNAVAVFVAGNSFLDFYIDACQRVVGRIEGQAGLVNQLVGPKLLSSLHNTIGYPLIDNVGMLSPLVLQDIAQGGGAALDLLAHQLPSPIQAANLCASLAGGLSEGIDLNEILMEAVVDSLLASRGGKLNRQLNDDD